VKGQAEFFLPNFSWTEEIDEILMKNRPISAAHFFGRFFCYFAATGFLFCRLIC
jgi:hypothetical protein